MNDTKTLLIACSHPIIAKTWLEKNIIEIIPKDKILNIIFIGENKHIEEILKNNNIKFTHPIKEKAPKRYQYQKYIENSDYCLVFWDGRNLTDLVFELRIKKKPSKILAIRVTEVVNKEKTEDYDIYIGRGTPWGNPFPVGQLEGQYERSEAVRLYKKHFEEKIITDEKSKKMLLGLSGMRLACHCKPFECHGDIIAKYLNEIDPDSINN